MSVAPHKLLFKHPNYWDAKISWVDAAFWGYVARINSKKIRGICYKPTFLPCFRSSVPTVSNLSKSKRYFVVSTFYVLNHRNV